MSERKIIYKARYVVDIEIEQVRSEDGRYTKILSPEIDIKSEIIIRETDPRFYNDAEAYDHIEKHFPDEIRESFARLYVLESLALDNSQIDVRSHMRKAIIGESQKWIDKSIRKRLPTKVGRKPDKAKSDYETKRKQFISEITQGLKNGGKGISKEKFAEKYFPDSDNPLKAFNAKLRHLNVSWKDLKNYNNFT